ncbi:hypothetical protein LTR36_004869 [Oleoguttula mirabilis]|uniref:Uncharacterized protein n=1 Tax=Oleoguttula mirabilis TaxID=1507867 RepID=A0AAV9JF55_9PEZI|nr:hypothetical protein LTR36_004869 [Oleoguttula mirabilis]
MAASSFMERPLELRERVYKLVFETYAPSRLYTCPNPYEQDGDYDVIEHPDHIAQNRKAIAVFAALCSANKQLKREVTPVVFSTFHLHFRAVLDGQA